MATPTLPAKRTPTRIVENWREEFRNKIGCKILKASHLTSYFLKPVEISRCDSRSRVLKPPPRLAVQFQRLDRDYDQPLQDPGETRPGRHGRGLSR